MNIESRVKRLEDKVMSPMDTGGILSIAGDTIEELTQNAIKTIREAIRKGQSWDNILLVCPAKLDDTDSVEQSIREEFGRGPEKIWVIPKEAIPDGW